MSKGKIIAIIIGIFILLGIIGSAMENDPELESNSTSSLTSLLTTSSETEYISEDNYSDTSINSTSNITTVTYSVTTETTNKQSTTKPPTTTKATTKATTTTKKATTKAQAVNSGTNAGFEVTMLDVGQGLSILVKSDGKYMLYDGGGRSRSSYVVSYLKSHGVTNLTYLVASHYDEDHIAGLVGVLNTTTVDTVIDPNYTTDTKIYSSYCTKLAENGAKEVHPSVGSTYSLGNAKITVVSPKNYYYEDENSRSIALRITYGNFSVIMTGDAESDAESDMISSGRTLSSDLYIVGHHGSSSSSSSSFVKKVSPAYAFISVGADNSYGHPTAKTLNTLKNNNVEIYRSDKQGEVTCYSDGNKYWFSEDPCNNYTAGNGNSQTTTKTTTTTVTYSQAVISDSSTYVLNTNTKKFHYPNCNSVSQMKEKNRQYVSLTRDEIIAQGYQPCGNCKP